MSDARDRWLDEGLRVLAEEGATGLRIDRIAARLGLSKGSFHHHFDGADGYKRDLLEHFERLSIQLLDRAIADAGHPRDARAVLGHLTALIEPHGVGLYRPELDVAVRAWSISDAAVRAVQERIDQARLAALQRVWRPHVATDEEARTAALLPYLVAVGATVVTPQVDSAELRKLFELLLPLIPEGASTAAEP